MFVVGSVADQVEEQKAETVELKTAELFEEEVPDLIAR